MRCYHHNDADGRCAAAIIYQKFPECELIEVYYKSNIDVSAIKKDEQVFIVDFSFKPELMNQVLEITENVTWIDHHKTAFEYEKQYNKKIKSVLSNELSGCELTWDHIMRDHVPEAVALIGDHDMWKFRFGDRTRYFVQGLRAYHESAYPRSFFWEQLLSYGKWTENDSYTRRIDKIVEVGSMCIRYRDNFCADIRKSFGFPVIFEGYRCYALNLYGLGSDVFGDIFPLYDICITFAHDGKRFVVGLYTENEDIDVGQIAKRYGGGGHKKASGFSYEVLPFNAFTPEPHKVKR